ncbi:MAG: iron-sulfur cluster-binding domain-containing protein [bacterium]|nr:iron-sulfur cluster-binding domain-containing protein [bacterium]MDE0353606.1 iron-sulfur cluster-binding domain-containing protein [bacterium]
MSPEDRTAHPVRIARIRSETADAVTAIFDDPDQVIGGSAGWYVIVRVMLDGEEHRRAFSLSSTPELAQPPAITVKSHPGGLVSRHLVERAREGDVVEVEPAAAGGFDMRISTARRRTLYCFAAGSGIAPIVGIIRGVLALEGGSVVHLLYGNRAPRDAIAAGELATMAADYADRFRLSRLFSGRGERIDHRAVDQFLTSRPPTTADVWYLVCGPPGMNRTVEARLRSLGAPDDRLLVEHYQPPHRDGAPTPYDGALVRLEDQDRGGRATAGDVLLDALGGPSSPLHYACRSGVCGTCRALVVGGEVDPGVPFALAEAEQAAGVVLTCVARPLSAEVVLRLLP